MPITIQQGVLNYKNSLGEFQNIDVLKGDTGPTGNPGEQGIPGVSPSISIADITGGHRVTITDATGPHSFDVIDGTDGDDGRSILSVQKTGTEVLADTYTITYTDNTTTTFTITNGANGTDGATFTPSVSEQGVISWTNDGGKTNPQSINIKGPQGPQGDPGDDYVLTAADKAEIAQQAAAIDNKAVVSGTTPTINAQAGVRYVCGEVASISITPPASGCIDVIFESGSTAAVLTVPNTVKWPAWFDPTVLEANATYEINILDGVYGAVGVWT